MIVDTSAVVAILLNEPDADEFLVRLAAATAVRRMSVVSRVELSMVLSRFLNADA